MELAAKAAGYTLYPEWDCAPAGIFLGSGEGDDLQVVWNPLENDGDALRLAVRLGLHVRVCRRSVFVEMRELGDDVVAKLGSDPCAATRRAIVLAAAELARSGNPPPPSKQW